MSEDCKWYCSSLTKIQDSQNLSHEIQLFFPLGIHSIYRQSPVKSPDIKTLQYNGTRTVYICYPCNSCCPFLKIGDRGPQTLAYSDHRGMCMYQNRPKQYVHVPNMNVPTYLLAQNRTYMDPVSPPPPFFRTWELLHCSFLCKIKPCISFD